MSPVSLPGDVAAQPGARTHYAFESTGAQGTVRVIVIDNSRGSLAASDPYQDPAEPQAPWLPSSGCSPTRGRAGSPRSCSAAAS